jgi:hypothetical protein
MGGGSGDPDLKVDYDLLGEFEKNLTFVHDEFAGLGKQIHTLDGSSSWGTSGVASAMDDFERSWSYHRTKLEGSISTLLTMVTQTKTTFLQADQDLAKALHNDDAPAAKTGH